MNVLKINMYFCFIEGEITTILSPLFHDFGRFEMDLISDIFINLMEQANYYEWNIYRS